MRISDWSSDVCSSDLSAPAAFEVVRVDAAGKVAPLPEAQLRLYRENRRYYWRYDDQRGWNSGYTDTEELVESRVIALPDRTSLSLPVGWGRYRLEIADRSEEHTSEHQSLMRTAYAVFCL